MSLEELAAEIGKLPLNERTEPVGWIVQSLDELPETEILALWLEESEHRLDEVLNYPASGTPAEEVFRHIRSSLQ